MARQRSWLILRLAAAAGALIVAGAAVLFVYKFIHRQVHASDSVAALQDYWSVYDYPKVYAVSANILDRQPLHNMARTLHGYSAYYLAVMATDTSVSLAYADEALANLRIALQTAREDSLPQVEYMLGKTYFYKDKIANYYYYADLVVKYLTLCQEHGYEADDTAEYLGLSYLALGETLESIKALSIALDKRETDTLLLNMAEQYCKIGQGNVAKQYLSRVLLGSNNDDLILRSHILLGRIYTDEANYTEARKEFETILGKNENFADAYYELGVLYEKQGDMAKARSEWRQCLKFQPNHPGATQKLSNNG